MKKSTNETEFFTAVSVIELKTYLNMLLDLQLER